MKVCACVCVRLCMFEGVSVCMRVGDCLSLTYLTEVH